jgi:hypothetical protein
VVKLHFKNTDEFEKVFKVKDESITDAIVQGVQEAVSFQKKTAQLFEISFDEVDLAYEISLPSSQWETALENCLDHYREIEESDKAIDTYLLQKEVRKWLS